MSEDSHTQVADKREAPIRIVLPFKDQKSANVVRKQLADLSRKINADISPVYTSQKDQESNGIKVSTTRADTYTNELKNTKDRQSENTSESSTIWS